MPIATIVLAGAMMVASKAQIPEGAKRPPLHFPTLVGTKSVYLVGKEEVTVRITDRKQVKDTTFVTVHAVYPDGSLVLRRFE